MKKGKPKMVMVAVPAAEGKGFLSSLIRAGRSVVKPLVKPVLTEVKRSGIVGDTIGMVPVVGQVGKAIARSQGYGRKRKAAGAGKRKAASRL